MWLINTRTRKLEFFQGRTTPKYAILSHRWEEEEVSFQEMMQGQYATRKGYAKIDKCCETAIEHKLNYAWVDTCCIDKSSSAELSEAINSMFKWYQCAEICFAYLSDVSVAVKNSMFLRNSAWFSRGWTLQELLAPDTVLFYDRDWQCIGSKTSDTISTYITAITSIPSDALLKFEPNRHSIAQRMSWASKRVTTREEDQAYCLMGMFGINMPMLYGEGEMAFQRLQEEIIKISDDRSIFLWSGRPNPNFGLFASDPSCFSDSGDCQHLTVVPADMEIDTDIIGYAISNAGLVMRLNLETQASKIYTAILGCYLVQGGLRVFSIFIETYEDHQKINRYRRISLYGKFWTSTIERLDQSKSGSLTTTILVRAPLVDRCPEKGYGFRCEGLNVGYVGINTYGIPMPASLLLEVRKSRTTVYELRVPPHQTFSIIGCMYSMTIEDSLVVLTLGFDSDAGPICLLDLWPGAIAKDAAKLFGFKCTNTGYSEIVHNSKLKAELLYQFEILPPSSRPEPPSQNGVLLAFRGRKEADTCFVYNGTLFEFRRTPFGFDLIIDSHYSPMSSIKRSKQLPYSIWPARHQLDNDSRDGYFGSLLAHLQNLQQRQRKDGLEVKKDITTNPVPGKRSPLLASGEFAKSILTNASNYVSSRQTGGLWSAKRSELPDPVQSPFHNSCVCKGCRYSNPD